MDTAGSELGSAAQAFLRQWMGEANWHRWTALNKAGDIEGSSKSTATFVGWLLDIAEREHLKKKDELETSFPEVLQACQDFTNSLPSVSNSHLLPGMNDMLVKASAAGPGVSNDSMQDFSVVTNSLAISDSSGQATSVMENYDNENYSRNLISPQTNYHDLSNNLPIPPPGVSSNAPSEAGSSSGISSASGCSRENVQIVEGNILDQAKIIPGSNTRRDGFGEKFPTYTVSWDFSKDNNVTCPTCNFDCGNARNLSAHLLTHKNRRQYRCGLCDYITPRQYDLKKHLKQHTGDRPHVCPHCQRRFATISNFNQHVLVHTKETQRFMCKVCGKAFTARAVVMRHLAKKHPDHLPSK